VPRYLREILSQEKRATGDSRKKKEKADRLGVRKVTWEEKKRKGGRKIGERVHVSFRGKRKYEKKAMSKKASTVRNQVGQWGEII